MSIWVHLTVTPFCVEQKILTMVPTEEEKLKIQEAHQANPDVPLGTAEQFLSSLTSISALTPRLQLWAFKLNYEVLEKVCLCLFLFHAHKHTDTKMSIGPLFRWH